MRVKIRTEGFRLSLPVPVSLAGFIIRLLPARLYDEMRADVPEPYSCLLTREGILGVLSACMDIVRENRGLEVVHVEAGDGTFVSIKL